MPQSQNNLDSQYLYFFLPALPVITGGILFIAQNELSLATILVILLLICCGIGCGWVLWQRHFKELELTRLRWIQDENTKLNAVATYTTELERLLLTISPILSQHVMVSREHTEQEIISLTSRFSSMVNELQQIVDSTGSTVGEQHFHLDSVLNTSRDFLHPVLTSLQHIQLTQQQAKQELQLLSSSIQGLDDLTDQVTTLSDHLKQFALSPGVDSKAATNLENKASHLEQQLNEKVKAMTIAVTNLLASADQAARTDNELLSQAETNINQTLTHLGLALKHYRDDVDALRNNAEQIRGEINNVLVALQFQDRVSQILTQVENNLLNLQQTIETIQQQGTQRDGTMLQVDAAVEHIENNYKSVSSRTEREADGSDDLTFF